MHHGGMTIDWPALAARAYPPAEPQAAVQPGSTRARCKAHVASTGAPCKNWPIAGGAVCLAHGGRAPQVKDAAARRVQEQQALALARRTIGGTDLGQFSDPFAALEFSVSYSHALAVRLAKIVEALPDDQLRYQGKIGEQLRGEVTAAQRALSDLRAAAEGSLKLGLAERRARISEQRVEVITRALVTALQGSGLPADGQEKARAILARELKKASATEGNQDDG